ncbi:MBL fold metallo-hydrolase [Metabacillus iocasae]|uniref:Glyoxylase-like metal-dependent hydrolase (Beta-lactamase superfamily II) n=1 Tax=Priestia iocasae TaxID=2291674 RepID=A0ABS2QWP0_9BACI|nr:MBL fold metallo-hydrolase [Metabacillus iocasae]MBM7703881.1 glyoxylase-like metal-dependent hydrolase (beta-lactamase superfamily II) [Metabacillus iocasae]
MIEISTHSGVVCAKGTVSLQDAHMNIYVFLTDNMLVDTGPESLLQEFIPLYRLESFDFVALTHLHEDHTGCAPWIEQNKHIPIYIHEMSIDDSTKEGSYPRYRQHFWGARHPFHPKPLQSTFTSENYKWTSIYTPGHADDHMVFLNNDTGMLFSGDLFVTPKTKIIMRDESISTIIESIRTVLQHDFQEMFCSHAGYVKDGKVMLQRKLSYLEELEGKILHLHNQGQTIQEIKKALFPVPYPLITLSEHEWDSEHIVTSVVNAQSSSIKK